MWPQPQKSLSKLGFISPLFFQHLWGSCTLGSCSCNQIRGRPYGFKLFVFCLWKEQCLGPFPPLFNWLYPSPAAAPSQLSSPGAAGPCSAPVPAASPAVAGETQKSWARVPAAQQLRICCSFTGFSTHIVSSILFCLTYIPENDLGP